MSHDYVLFCKNDLDFEGMTLWRKSKIEAGRYGIISDSLRAGTVDSGLIYWSEYLYMYWSLWSVVMMRDSKEAVNVYLMDTSSQYFRGIQEWMLEVEKANSIFLSASNDRSCSKGRDRGMCDFLVCR